MRRRMRGEFKVGKRRLSRTKVGERGCGAVSKHDGDHLTGTSRVYPVIRRRGRLHREKTGGGGGCGGVGLGVLTREKGRSFSNAGV